MNFSAALILLKSGAKCQRDGWNGKGLWVEVQYPDDHSKMTLPYLYLVYPPDGGMGSHPTRVPWLASQTDLMADDWRTLV